MANMLLTSQNIKDQRILVVGSTNVVKSRVTKLLDHGAVPVVIGNPPRTIGEKPAIGDGEKTEWHDRDFDPTDLTNLGREEVDGIVDAVFVCYHRKELEKSKQIADICKRLRIPINVVDQPELCTFSLLSTHSDGDFQVGISTSGKGCRLANRLKRHVINSLPPNVGEICQRVGELRSQIRNIDEEELGQLDDDAEQNSRFNKLVVEQNQEQKSLSIEEQKKQRLRWLSQVVEYYPLEKLGSINISDLTEEYCSQRPQNVTPAKRRLGDKGKISLVGAGPGDASLLTSAALQAIHSADLILTDKLVPQAVLDLIPKQTPVQVAKKFPGNAERAQQELLQTGLEAVEQGQHVVRLKQGDPYIFGRGAEEFVYFSERGYTPEVICGITSALSAPLLAKIPATHRNVADQVLFMTGTGRAGAVPNFPEYVSTRTCVFLMSLHRIDTIVDNLASKGWDLDVPCCVIERSSCPDQRIIRTRLKHVVEAIEQLGSRPPGLLVTGHACEVIEKLDSASKWTVTEGL